MHKKEKNTSKKIYLQPNTLGRKIIMMLLCYFKVNK